MFAENIPAIPVIPFIVPDYRVFYEMFTRRGVVRQDQIHGCIVVAVLLLSSSFLGFMDDRTDGFLCARHHFLHSMSRMFSEHPELEIIRLLLVGDDGASIMAKVLEEAEKLTKDSWYLIPPKTKCENIETDLTTEGYMSMSYFLVGHFFK